MNKWSVKIKSVHNNIFDSSKMLKVKNKHFNFRGLKWSWVELIMGWNGYGLKLEFTASMSTQFKPITSYFKKYGQYTSKLWSKIYLSFFLDACKRDFLSRGHLDFCWHWWSKFSECRSYLAQRLLVFFHEIGWIIRCNHLHSYRIYTLPMTIVIGTRNYRRSDHKPL